MLPLNYTDKQSYSPRKPILYVCSRKSPVRSWRRAAFLGLKRKFEVKRSIFQVKKRKDVLNVVESRKRGWHCQWERALSEEKTKQNKNLPVSNKVKEQRDARVRFLVADQRERQSGHGYKEQWNAKGCAVLKVRPRMFWLQWVLVARKGTEKCIQGIKAKGD